MLLIAVTLTSCSTDSNSDNNSFFNLHEGNLWVYKRYTSYDNVNYTATTYIDSVRVTGDTLINNLTYAKVVHTAYYNPKEYLRVDSNGHLVDQSGYVHHPGTDTNYQNIRPVIIGGTQNVGSLTEQLQSPFTTTIEGLDYFVYPYYGTFISTEANIPNNYIFYQYEENTGLVCQRIVALSGYESLEDRLIYHELH